jgi:hypothetical protein
VAKTLINFSPAFVPGAANVGYLDFTGMDPEFAISKLYAVINLTRNVVMYAPGASGIGGSTTSTNFGDTSAFPANNPCILTLSLDTSTYSSTDILNVIYDVNSGRQGPSGDNTPQERGGISEAQYIVLAQILTELRVQNEILLEGLMGRTGVGRESTDDYRDEQVNPVTLNTNSGFGS